MRRASLLAVAVVIFAGTLASCDSMSRDQLLIKVSGEPAIEARTADLRNTLLAFAADRSLQDITQESEAEGTVVLLKTEDEHFPILIGARNVNGELVVDLIHFHPGPGETEPYSKLKADLTALLEKRYGHDVRLLPRQEYREGKRRDEAPNQ